MSKEKTVPAASNRDIVEQTTIAGVYQAARQLEGVACKTRLIASDYFSELSGNQVFLKPENLQHTGAFKLRGAYNKISQLTDEERKKGSSPPRPATMHRALLLPLSVSVSKP